MLKKERVSSHLGLSSISTVQEKGSISPLQKSRYSSLDPPASRFKTTKLKKLQSFTQNTSTSVHSVMRNFEADSRPESILVGRDEFCTLNPSHLTQVRILLVTEIIIFWKSFQKITLNIFAFFIFMLYSKIKFEIDINNDENHMGTYEIKKEGGEGRILLNW